MKYVVSDKKIRYNPKKCNEINAKNPVNNNQRKVMFCAKYLII